jgi:hypothetical protein
MATFNRFNSFSTELANGSHNFKATGGHTFKVMLTNSAPIAANSLKSDITEIAAGNGYIAGGETLAITRTNTSGTEKITVSGDIVWTGGASAMATFQYIVVYNDTQTSPLKPLVGWLNYGSAVILNPGETFTVDFDQANGLFTVG